MELFYQFLRMFYIVLWLPGVMCFGVSFPLYEIMKFFVSSDSLQVQNLLNFIFFFSINDIRWWL